LETSNKTTKLWIATGNGDQLLALCHHSGKWVLESSMLYRVCGIITSGMNNSTPCLAHNTPRHLPVFLWKNLSKTHVDDLCAIINCGGSQRDVRMVIITIGTARTIMILIVCGCRSPVHVSCGSDMQKRECREMGICHSSLFPPAIVEVIVIIFYDLSPVVFRCFLVIPFANLALQIFNYLFVSDVSFLLRPQI
jgi:hypothetical protein